MEFDEKQIQGLQRLLSLLNPDTLTRDQFVSSFETVLQKVVEIEKKNIQEIGMMKETIDNILGQLKTDTSDNVENLKGEVKRLVEQEHNRLRSEHQGKMSEIDNKMMEVKDGKDADEEMIVEKVCGMIKIPTIEELKDDLPKMSNEVRDALEILQGEERLDVSAIKGLEELISKNKVVGGGGFSKIAMDSKIVDPYIPTGLVNGINKDFVAIIIPNPASSLKVYKDGQLQNLTTDYTVSKKTVTFNDAPLTDSIIKFEHRI